MGTDRQSDESGDSRVDYRQVSFVAGAGLAIVLAAVLLPGFAGGGWSPSTEFSPGGDSDRDADGPDIDFDWTELLDWFDWGDSGDGPSPEPGPGDDSCTVRIDRDPVPGAVVTVTIEVQGQPLADVPVRFNDRVIGETDDRGRVTGEVPYTEELVITVAGDGEDECVAAGPVAGAAISAIGAGSEATAGVGSEAAIGGTATPVAATAGTIQESNSSVEYEIDGEINITVIDDPYPGEPVEIQAAIEGEPMRAATVTVDGEPVTETDTVGRATITVPDDGSEQVGVGVERGAFAETATIDILLLDARLIPGGLAPVPGSDGAVAAEIDGDPIPGAVVTIDGEEQGRTDAMGELAVELPRDPTTTVTVATDDQTATVTLGEQYADAIVVLSLFVAGLAAVAHGRYGVRGPIGVGVLTAGAGLVLVVEAFYGPLAGGGVLAVGVAIAVGAVLGRSDVSRRSLAVRDTTPGVTAWLVDRVLVVVGALERLADRGRQYVGVVAGWLGSLPRSATALLMGLAGWLGSLPGRVRTAIASVTARARTVQPKTVAFGIGAAGMLGGSYHVGDWIGLLVAAAALAVAIALRRGRSVADGDASSRTSADREPPAPAVDAVESQSARRSIRALWRSVARRVTPRRWRTRTPGEIERTAIEKGYPREPLRELTTLFREVEYGDRAVSRRVRERADAAVEALRSSNVTESGTDGPTETDTVIRGRSAADTDGAVVEESAGETDGESP